MSMNILAMLLSLAMMLTGAGGTEPVAETARTLTISDIVLTYNGESVALNPSLSLGAMVAEGGEKAIAKLAVENGDARLFPIQITVDDSALSVLFEKSGASFSVSAATLDALMESGASAASTLAGGVEGSNAYGSDGADAQALLNYMFKEFMPAYGNLIKAAQDPKFEAEISEIGEAALAAQVDRGEGVAETLTVDGETYDVTHYSYTLDTDQICAISDAVMAAHPALAEYSEKLFKLYAMLPEETGLSGVASYRDLFEKTGMGMTMQIEERLTADGGLDVTDAVMTMTMPNPAEFVEGEGEGDAIALEPMVYNIHAVERGEASEVTLNCDYTIEDQFNIKMDIAASQDPNNQSMAMTMIAGPEEDDVLELSAAFESETDPDTGDTEYSLGYGFAAPERADMLFSATAEGTKRADGSAENAVELIAKASGDEFGLAFNANVGVEPLQDASEGASAYEIKDLSEDPMEDDLFSALAMQVIGSLYQDAQTLMAEESVAELAGLFMFTPQEEDEPAPETDDDVSVSTADDDELAFNEPEFTWLPEGWRVSETNVDTAYDNVDVIITDADERNSIYAYFYAVSGDPAVSYTVAADGSLAPVEERVVDITGDVDSGYWSVSMTDKGVSVSLYVYSSDIDAETIGKIIAGLTL